METQAGPNEDSRDDENDDEAEEDDSTEEPHDFSDSFKPLITKVEQLFTGWKHGFLGATKQLFRGSVSFSAVLACFGAPLGHHWLLFYFKREMGSLENKKVFIRLSYFTIIPSEETPDPVSDSFL